MSTRVKQGEFLKLLKKKSAKYKNAIIQLGHVLSPQKSVHTRHFLQLISKLLQIYTCPYQAETGLCNCERIHVVVHVLYLYVNLRKDMYLSAKVT